MNDMDQTEFDFSENQETEQERLEREVLAAGGRVGKSEGRFNFGFDESKGYKRGDEHRGIEGLYYWHRNKGRQRSSWVSGFEFSEINEKVAERQKGYWWENKERIAERQRGYWGENKERIAESRKRHYEENKERLLEDQKRWREENPEKKRAAIARYRAKLREAVDPSANNAIVDSRYKASQYLSDVTGIEWHVDHTMPLYNGGKHHEENLQVVPAKWNMSKGANHDKRWIEDSNIYRYATAVEKRFEEEAKKTFDIVIACVILRHGENTMHPLCESERNIR